ncbi:MAG: hypothetical protein C4304_03415 [candidate division GAL15 bacterium]
MTPLAVWALSLALGGNAPAAAPEVLDRVSFADQQVAYSGEQLVTTWEEKLPQAFWVHVQHDPAVGTRLVIRSAAGAHRQVVWHTPHHVLQYDARTRQGRVYRFSHGRVSRRTQVTWLQRNYFLTASPTQLLGRPALRLHLTPRHPGRPRADLRVDTETGVVLRSERISPDGRSRELATFVRFAVRPVGWMRPSRPPADLQLQREPPVRSVTLDEVAARWGRQPPEVWLPAGFYPMTPYLLEGSVVRRAYSDGLATLLVSIRPAVSPQPPAGSRPVHRTGGPVWVQSAGLRQVLYWTYAGWSFTLIGELGPEALLEVADRTGVQPAPTVLEALLRWLGHSLRLSDL